MKRNVITIDEMLCNGCGLCVSACHEGAIQLLNGKAHLVSDTYCDGLGDCLPHCPTGAITIEERETVPYDEKAVQSHIRNQQKVAESTPACACTGTIAHTLERPLHPGSLNFTPVIEKQAPVSQLRQWPVQIKLVPVNAPYFHNADLLIAATCSAFTYAQMHEDFIKNKITLIGCPKLDGVDYGEKLAGIFSANEIKSVTVVRMDVPCCGGLTQAVKRAFSASGTIVPWQVVTLSTEGKILES